MVTDRFNLREVYVETLCQLAKERADFVVLDADSKEATQVDRFARLFPNRSFSFGIAEQNRAQVSRVIGDTVDAGMIRSYNPESESRRHASYVPYWA